MDTRTWERGNEILEFDGEFDRLPLGKSNDIETRHLADGNSRRGCAEDERDFATFVEERLISGTASLYSDATAWMERRLLVRVLCATNGNKSKACQILGITRGSLRHKICQLGISIHQTVSVQKANLY